MEKAVLGLVFNKDLYSRWQKQNDFQLLNEIDSPEIDIWPYSTNAINTKNQIENMIEGNSKINKTSMTVLVSEDQWIDMDPRTLQRYKSQENRFNAKKDFSRITRKKLIRPTRTINVAREKNISKEKRTIHLNDLEKAGKPTITKLGLKKATALQRTKIVNCQYCTYNASQMNKIHAHVKNTHDQIKEYTCDECNYSSFHKSHIKRHTSLIHQGIRTFKCSFCKYSSCSKSEKDAHVNASHDLVKFNKCNLCSYSACQLKTLKSHLFHKHKDIVHPSVRSYMCDQCGYLAYSKHVLNIHIERVHNRLKQIKAKHDLASYKECNLFWNNLLGKKP